MPVKTSGNHVESIDPGFSPMAEVLQGYLYGEEVQRQRFQEERAYAFDREKFEEGVRQFDVSLEEQVRQFDTSLAFSAEQAALDRDLKVDLQDDQQSFLADQAKKDREFSHVETALERRSREEHQQKQRALEYHRIKKNVEMQNADRALQYEKSQVARMRRFLGDAKDYDSMPDFYYVGRDGKRYSENEIDIKTELQSIIDGHGSVVLNVDAETAKVHLDSIMKGGVATEAAIIDSYIGDGVNTAFVGIEENVEKAAGLYQLMVERAGGDPNALQSMSAEELEFRKNTVIHDLNNFARAEQYIQNKELDYLAEINNIQNGSSAYVRDPYASIAAANGQYFVWDSEVGLPTWSGRGSSVTGRYADEYVGLGRDYLRVADPLYYPDLTEEQIIAEQSRIQTEMKKTADRMAEIIKSEGGDIRQVDMFTDAVLAYTEGRQPDPSVFKLDTGRALVDGTRPRKMGVGQSKGVVQEGREAYKTGDILPGGEVFTPKGAKEQGSPIAKTAQLMKEKREALAEVDKQLATLSEEATTLRSQEDADFARYSVEGAPTPIERIASGRLRKSEFTTLRHQKEVELGKKQVEKDRLLREIEQLNKGL